MPTDVTAPRCLDEWLAYIQTVHFRSIDMTLDRVAEVLGRLLESGPSFRIIAVAGTNGKGSCAAMLGAVLARCGWKVGVYTSPHLVRFNERIRIDDGEARDEELCAAFEHIEACRGDVPLTYFEFATLAAVEVFQSRGVDYAVMEVGMGGRLDAVNALPIEASLITNVELDHMLVDRAAMELVLRPTRFDVILTGNLFGDILSDEAAAVVGSLGILGSASVGGRTDLYEPVHGSAPELAGKDVANPIAAIASVALMLRHSFSMHAEADAVDDAVEQLLSEGRRTADLAGEGEEALGTRAFGDAVLEILKG